MMSKATRHRDLVRTRIGRGACSSITAIFNRASMMSSWAYHDQIVNKYTHKSLIQIFTLYSDIATWVSDYRSLLGRFGAASILVIITAAAASASSPRRLDA